MAYKKFKTSKDNPLYKNFGLLQNTVFCLKQIKKYSPIYFLILALQIFTVSFFDYFWGIVNKYIIDVITAPVSLQEKQVLLVKTICIIGLIMLVVTIIKTITDYNCWIKEYTIQTKTVSERINKVLCINYDYLEAPEVLDIHARAQRATDGGNGMSAMLSQMKNIGAKACTVVVTFIAVTVLDYRLILVLFICSILNYLFYKFIIKFDKKHVWDQMGPYWRRSNYLKRKTQDFDSAKDIRLFNLSNFFIKKYKDVHTFSEGRIDFHENCWMAYSTVTRILNIVSQLCVYATVIYAVIGKDMSIANFSMYLGFAMAFSSSLVNILQLLGDFERSSLQLNDFRSFMQVDNYKNDHLQKRPIPKTNEYEIQFHNVSYTYPEAPKPSLSNLNLTIRSGEKLSVVGLNGAGKTTMIKLLLRLYDPTEGEITLNGINIREFEREEYYKLFAPVFQDVQIFAFPLKQNVSMKEVKNTDDKLIFELLEKSGLGEKVKSLKKGIDTELLKVVDEEGIDLSGGQRQKLALARSLYKNAPIVVLDEPTAALDALAEKELYEKFSTLIGEKTSVYISHRLASTRFCDNIAMFMDGKMVEYGTHEDLMKKKGEYAHMFEVQAQYYKEDATVEEN